MLENQNLWLLREDPTWGFRLSAELDKDPDVGINNFLDLDEFLSELLHTRSMTVKGDPLIPEGSLHPIITLPVDSFAPDYFEFRNMMFVSERFRLALSQSADVVQYWPVQLRKASEAAQKQKYCLFRVLAWQPAMDLTRSECTQEQITNRRSGEKLNRVSFIDRFVPLPSLIAHTEIFRAAEDRTSVLVTDALAERVMKAGCEGVCFREPETIGMVNREPRRVRTADGIFVEDADLAEWASARQ